MEGSFPTSANIKKLTIGILVARSKNRLTKDAVNRAKVAKSAGYNIILTDENDLYSDLINFVESRRRLDGSNNTLYIFLFLILLLQVLIFVLLMLIRLK